MTTERNHGEDLRTRREWMIEEFRQAQRARREGASPGVVEPTQPGDVNGAGGGAVPDGVVVTVSRP